jgi:hypothetical protein
MAGTVGDQVSRTGLVLAIARLLQSKRSLKTSMLFAEDTVCDLLKTRP